MASISARARRRGPSARRSWSTARRGAVERGDELVDPLPRGGDGAHHGRAPGRAVDLAAVQRDHVLELLHGGVRAVPVGLVDHEDVGHLEDPGLGRLDGVPHPGGQEHDRRVGQGHDLHLRLAHPHRLDQDHVAPGGVEDAQGLRRRGRQTTQMAAGGHRSDEHPGVRRVVTHPDPIAEQRATGERRAGVDREHADAPVVGPQGGDQRGRRRRLPHARASRSGPPHGRARCAGRGPRPGPGAAGLPSSTSEISRAHRPRGALARVGHQTVQIHGAPRYPPRPDRHRRTQLGKSSVRCVTGSAVRFRWLGCAP